MIQEQSSPARDSLASIIDEVFSDPAYRWSESSGWWQWVREAFSKTIDWLEALRADHPVVYVLFIAANIAILLAILSHFGYVVSRTLKYRPDAERGRHAAPEIHDARWHLRAARLHGEAGRFAEALAHRFTALVLTLDEHDALQFHPSKTPAEYAREVKLTTEARERFGDLITALYRTLFGGEACTSDDWAAFDRAAAELPRHVAAN